MKKLIIQSIVIISVTLTAGCAGPTPKNIGIHQGRLTDCPDRPNCVSSQTDSSDNAIAPFEYTQSRKEAIQTLMNVIKALPRAKLNEKSDTYVYVEVKSKIFGFVDDVEFFIPEKEAVIHVRSASRLGYSDFGVNRKRIESIRKDFSKEGKK